MEEITKDKEVNKEVVRQELGNYTIIYDKNKKPDVKVIKCPYFNCNDIFFEHLHYEQHLILKHGEMPYSILQKAKQEEKSENNKVYNNYFSKHRLATSNQYIFKHKLKTYKMMLDLYFKVNKEKSLERKNMYKQKQKIKMKEKSRRPETLNKKEPKKNIINRFFGFFSTKKVI